MIHINQNILNASQDYKILRQSTGKSIQGFTLVELSIVLIIISLLVAGISAGSSMIKQATINSVIIDMQSYQTAYDNFLSTYKAVPGDFQNAYAFWGAACADNASNCNGNGNGLIEPSLGGGDYDEGVKAWKHLALANMVSGVSTPPLGSNPGGFFTIIGRDVPASKVGNAGYVLASAGHAIGVTGNASPWTDDSTNAVFIATKDINYDGTNGAVVGAALTPQDTFNIDQKIDDGTISGTTLFTGAATGRFRATDGSDLGGNDPAPGNCATTNSADKSGIKLNDYNSTVTTISCVAGVALN